MASVKDAGYAGYIRGTSSSEGQLIIRMITDFSFTKLYAGDATHAAATSVLQWLDDQCSTHGLQPVQNEKTSHFSVLMIVGAGKWLHLDTLGHFLPEATKEYKPLTHLLSEKYPVVSFRGRDGGPYILRRITDGNITARYAVYEAGRRYPTPESAALWNPVLEDWQDLLASDNAAANFYQLLPPPQHPDTPTPTAAFDRFDLPEHFNQLFGWNPELNYASIEFLPDGPKGRGDFYEANTGDYVDEERKLKVFVRHYAHPTSAGYQFVF